MNQFQ